MSQSNSVKIKHNFSPFNAYLNNLTEFRMCHLVVWVVVAKVVDVVDILVPDQGANPDEMNPGWKAPRSLRLLVDWDLHLH